MSDEKRSESLALVEARRELRDMSLAPGNFGDAWTMAQALAKSNLVPKAMIGKPSDILLTLMWARELKLGPAQGLAGIHVIEGRARPSAEMMVALVMRSGLAEYFQLIESSSEKCTYETKRVGAPAPTRLTWTMADARRAKLDGKDNWRNYPDAMLRARCSAALARAAYPDIMLGVQAMEEDAPPPAAEWANPLAAEAGPLDLSAPAGDILDGEVEPEASPTASEPAGGQPQAQAEAQADAESDPDPEQVLRDDLAACESLAALKGYAKQVNNFPDTNGQVRLRAYYQERRAALAAKEGA